MAPTLSHCWHDRPASTNLLVYADPPLGRGDSVCCRCGATRPWHEEARVDPLHGPYFRVIAPTWIWDGPEPGLCDPKPKDDHGKPAAES